MDRSFLAGLVFFAIFVLGMFAGGFLMLRWVKNTQVRVQKNGQQQVIVVPLGPSMVRQMLNELDLNRDQRKAANKILVENGDVIRILRRETDFALDRLQEDLDKLLTPDQRAKLGKLKDEQRVRVLDQREAVQRFLRQRHNGEATPVPPAASASGGNEQPSPATAAQAEPAPAPVETQAQPAVAPMQPVPAH